MRINYSMLPQWFKQACALSYARSVSMDTPMTRTLFSTGLMPNTHRRRRRDETVELRRVGGVNTPVGSRDPVYNFLCWPVHDDRMTSLLKRYKKSQTFKTLRSWFECLQTYNVMCYVISYFYSIGCRIVNLVTADGCVHIAESVGSRRELVANSCTHRRCRRDATRQFRRVGGVYWTLAGAVAKILRWRQMTSTALRKKTSKLRINASNNNTC